ncbi:MAG: DUF6691 family protein [Acidobacteriota bacterium]
MKTQGAMKPRDAVQPRHALVSLLPYLALGMLFGAVLVKAQVASWYRIQEMFHFASFHLYGVILSAVLTAGLSLALLRAIGWAPRGGEASCLQPKAWDRGLRYGLGGVLFGLGWGLSGACPGPMFALLGAGIPSAFLMLLSALAGTLAYGLLRSRLPH